MPEVLRVQSWGTEEDTENLFAFAEPVRDKLRFVTWCIITV